MFKKNSSSTETKVVVDIGKLKELRIYTPDGTYSFDTKGLHQVEGYGAFTKNRIEKVIKRIFNGEGVLKLPDGRKIDLTMQTQPPLVIYKGEEITKK